MTIAIDRTENPLQICPDQVTQFVATLKAQGIKHVRFEFSDLHGISRSKLVPINAVEEFSRTGLNFYGGMMGLDTASQIVPTTKLHEELNYRDGVLIPDFTTLMPLSWLDNTAKVICNYEWSAGNPIQSSPRYVYQRVLQVAAEMGFDVMMGLELEFYLLDAQTREPIFQGVHAFNTLRNQYAPIIDELLNHLIASGIDLIDHGCEYGPGQMEINYGPSIGIEAADKAFTFKHAVKEICQKAGYLATFMSRPFTEQTGCGCHVHVCLIDRETGKNTFLEPSDENGLSDTAKSFIQGILDHGAAMMPLIAPTPNCYRRYIEPTFVSIYTGWGIQDRTGMVRVKASHDESTHIEMRAASSISNPYLSAAATVAAGLLGIKQGLRLQPPIEGQGLHADQQLRCLPQTLDQALTSLTADREMCELLGDEFVQVFTAVKNHELNRFRAHVTDWEKNEYMEIY